jgi:SH3 domain-containing YSC84-like protein 1
MDSECLLFITTAKVAFLGGVKFGTGLLVNRVPGTPTGWSAPCAVGSFGLAFGAIAGVMVTDVIIPLRTADALAHFQKSFSFTLGGEAGFAFGPIGRNGCAEVDASSGGVSTALSLSNSKGIYGGVTLDGGRASSVGVVGVIFCALFSSMLLIQSLMFSGSVIKVRHDINQKFYGREHSVKEILDGTVPCPPAAQVKSDFGAL